MSDTSPPPGYVHAALPRSALEALATTGKAAIRTRSKIALEWYLRSFTDTDGVNRSLVPAIDQQVLTWITDRSIEHDGDPQYVRTQLARMFDDVKERVPAVLIVDHSFRWVPTGLSPVSAGRVVDGQWLGRFDVHAQVGVTISVLTHDQESTSTLADFLCIAINTVRMMVGGSRLCPPNCTWEVRLPMTLDTAASQSQPSGDDPVKRLWYSNIDLQLDYEDSFLVQQDVMTPNEQSLTTGGIIGVPNAHPEISCPDTIQINRPQEIGFSGVTSAHTIYIDRPGVAVLNLEELTVTARRLGEFAIVVTSSALPYEADSLATPAVVTRKTVRVVL